MKDLEVSENEQNSICVAGAGAIGIALAAKFSLAGYDVALVARGESLAAIRKDGVVLCDLDGSHRADVKVGDARDFGWQRIIFFCPKSHDLPGLASNVGSLINADTLIVPVINGIPWWFFDRLDDNGSHPIIEAVDPGGTLKTMLPTSQVIGTTAMITAERLRPGVSVTFNKLHMTIGELDDRRTERLEMLERILSSSGVETRIASCIRDAVWTKVARNLISNPVTALTGATLSQNFGDPYLSDISRRMLDEIAPVVEAYGSKLELEPANIIASGRGMGAVKTSMLQDLQNGRRLELASICDAVLELAKRKNMRMPVTETITLLAHFRDNDRNAAA